MRNIHLGLGLVFVLMALVFAVSSIGLIYRTWFDLEPTRSELQIQVSAEARATPRAAARELMGAHDLAGDLRQIEEKGGTVSFRIVRPGEAAAVEYDRATGQGKVEMVRHGVMQTLIQLHVNHGFWHDYMPANLWAAIGFFASVGLLLLGATGIYLWFALHKERVIGSVLLGFSLIFGLVTLVLTRLEG